VYAPALRHCTSSGVVELPPARVPQQCMAPEVSRAQVRRGIFAIDLTAPGIGIGT
jgi:hypothetical protein